METWKIIVLALIFLYVVGTSYVFLTCPLETYPLPEWYKDRPDDYEEDYEEEEDSYCPICGCTCKDNKG